MGQPVTLDQLVQPVDRRRAQPIADRRHLDILGQYRLAAAQRGQVMPMDGPLQRRHRAHRPADPMGMADDMMEQVRPLYLAIDDALPPASLRAPEHARHRQPGRLDRLRRRMFAGDDPGVDALMEQFEHPPPVQPIDRGGGALGNEGGRIGQAHAPRLCRTRTGLTSVFAPIRAISDATARPPLRLRPARPVPPR